MPGWADYASYATDRGDATASHRKPCFHDINHQPTGGLHEHSPPSAEQQRGARKTRAHGWAGLGCEAGLGWGTGQHAGMPSGPWALSPLSPLSARLHPSIPGPCSSVGAARTPRVRACKHHESCRPQHAPPHPAPTRHAATPPHWITSFAHLAVAGSVWPDCFTRPPSATISHLPQPTPVGTVILACNPTRRAASPWHASASVCCALLRSVANTLHK